MLPVFMFRPAIRMGMASVLFCGLFITMPVVAATFCVSSSTQLANALSTAESNGQDDVIKIKEGNYAAPQGGFKYLTFAGSGDDFDLEISGGWYDLFNFACLGHHDSPFQTLIDGNNTHPGFDVVMRRHSNFTLRTLTIINGDLPNEYDRGAGLTLFSDEGEITGTWTIESVAFVNNHVRYLGAALDIDAGSTGQARVRLINNLFTLNEAGQGFGAGHVHLNDGNGIFVVNNTIVNNQSDGNGTFGGGLGVGGINTPIFIANNNLWGNNFHDLDVNADPGEYQLLHNNIGIWAGDTPANSAGNISVEPEYQHGLFNFTPVRNSPLVDAGINPPPINTGNWYLTDNDLNGASRRVGDVDIGAYEQDIIFADGFSGTPAF